MSPDKNKERLYVRNAAKWNGRDTFFHPIASPCFYKILIINSLQNNICAWVLSEAPKDSLRFCKSLIINYSERSQMAVGWKIIRQIPIFPTHSAPSALQASLKPEDPPRSLIGIVLALEGCAFPYRSPREPWQQRETAGTKRLICGAYHGFSAPSALQASLKPKVQKKPHSFGMQPFFRCGEIGS